MRIIREADGGLSQHKINFKGVMSHFNSCVPVNFYPQVEQINDIMYYGYWAADPEQWYHDYGGEIMLSYQTIFEMKQDDYFNPVELDVSPDYYDEIDIAFSKFKRGALDYKLQASVDKINTWISAACENKKLKKITIS